MKTLDISNAFRYTIPESVNRKQRIYELEAKAIGINPDITASEKSELLDLYEEFNTPATKRVF